MQLTPVTKTQLAAAAVKPVGAVAAGPGVRPGVSIAPQRTNSEVPTSFTWTYTNSSGADRKLCIGDPSGWLSTLQSGTVVAATGFSYGYTAASLAVFLTRFTLSIGRIDLTATTAALIEAALDRLDRERKTRENRGTKYRETVAERFPRQGRSDA